MFVVVFFLNVVVVQVLVVDQRVVDNFNPEHAGNVYEMCFLYDTIVDA